MAGAGRSNLHLSRFRTGVPNLSLTMYPFSIPTDKHVPLQHSDG